MRGLALVLAGLAAVSGWLEHYHTERPHQSLDNEPLQKPKQRGRLK
jgi:transposase InsO family protein